MYINELLMRCNLELVTHNHKIENITDESFSVKENSIYVDLSNGKYITEVINSNVSTIITNKNILIPNQINLIIVDDVTNILARLLSCYYEDELKKIKIIAIVGTAGKSTTALLIYNYLNYTSCNSMYIGSLGVYYDSEILKTNNTTPKITDIYRYIELAAKNEIKYIVMEESSIAISENRVYDIPLYMLILTNIYVDHLDYHKTLDDYIHTKAIPFINSNVKHIIINKDINNYDLFIKYNKAKRHYYSIYNESKYMAYDIEETITNTTFKINGHIITTTLLSIMNVYNILPLFIINKILNHKLEQLIAYTYEMKPAPGRLNLYEINNKKIIIDYAHTIDEYKSLLSFITKVHKNKIHIICGCGGERQKDKRYQLGKLLEDYNIHTILTNDNPRGEDPQQIADDINKYVINKHEVILDRRLAILKTLSNSTTDDLILIVGKGNEEYIEINNKKYPYKDEGVLLEYKCLKQ